MFIRNMLKWFSYGVTGMVVLFLGLHVTFSLLNKGVPINQATKTCLITGASSGIGKALSREMIKRGWRVIGIARREEKLNYLAHELGQSFIPYVCDVSKPEQIHHVSEEIKINGLKPTLFFLNAGTGIVEAKFQSLYNKHKQTFDTNYFGTIAWIDEWIDTVKTYGGGTFVATSSIASLFATPGSAGYSASKSALNSCFQSLRLQYLHDNIGFVTVLPGPVETKMLKVKKKLPLTHQPEDEARYIVEQVFNRKQQIEPSWYYSCMLRVLSWYPDSLVLRLLE